VIFLALLAPAGLRATPGVLRRRRCGLPTGFAPRRASCSIARASARWASTRWWTALASPSPVCTAPSPPLAAAYLRDYDADFCARFERPDGKAFSNPREQMLAYIGGLASRAVQKGYRGCGLSNAAVEYPARDNPARRVAETHKRAFRKRLRELAAAMGARQPTVPGDALLLLIEGIYVTGQQSEDGPAQSALATAKLLIDASVGKA
jgi:hypothetical protein